VFWGASRAPCAKSSTSRIARVGGRVGRGERLEEKADGEAGGEGGTASQEGRRERGAKAKQGSGKV
jgi:hypothetical protein